MNTDKTYRYKNPYGTWRVTTEGDEEGRTTRELGTHTGYIDEIALALADKACYELNFQAAEPLQKNPTPTKTSVNVQLDIESGTWNMDADERCFFAEKMLQGRPVIVAGSNYFGCFVIRAKNEKDMQREILRNTALKKLNDAEKNVLGLL